MMIATVEQNMFEAEKDWRQIAELIAQAADVGRPIAKVEEDLWRRMLNLGQKVLQSFIERQGSGDLGATFEHEGQTLSRLPKLHDRRYVSVFGEIPIKRAVYGTRESQKHEIVPLDARLALPDGDFSYLLQKWDQTFCVKESFKEANATVQTILGIGQSTSSLERMNRAMARDVQEFRSSLPRPEEEGPIVVITADGKGVPMRRERGEQKASDKRRQKGKKTNKKRMSCVGAVYTIDPFVRSADDVVNEVMREECQKDRPVPQNKRVRAELTRERDGEEINAKDEIFSWFGEEVESRDNNHDKPLVCIMDGERSLWATLARFITCVVCILDLFHVMERLWDGANCFCAEGSEEAKAFVTARLERMLEGDVGRVIGGLKQMATKHNLRGAKLKRLRKVITYFENNRKYMAYDEYLANGYPIGSGVAEGACRHLVKDRMELTGMHWRVEGAQAMLALRSTYLNGDWEAFQQFRIEAERQKLYPERDRIQTKWLKAA